MYRKAIVKDLDDVMQAADDAREYLKAQGLSQWQDGYPFRDDFIKDINEGYLYVVLDDNDPNLVAGVCAITYKEEDYNHLVEGKWLSDLPYIVMHRVAVKKEYRGKGYGKKLFKLFFERAEIEGYTSLRIDTLAENIVMRNLIESFGFIYCGRVILNPNKLRVVYEKLI